MNVSNSFVYSFNKYLVRGCYKSEQTSVAVLLLPSVLETLENEWKGSDEHFGSLETE